MSLPSLLSLSLICSASGLRWAAPFQQNVARSNTQLQMSALAEVKERLSGRGDLASLVDEDEGESYKFFEESYEEEAKPPTTGDMITGTVVEMDDNGALLQISGKMSGYLPLKEASLIPVKHVKEVVSIGDELSAECIGTLKGMPVISLRADQLIKAWDEILKIKDDDTVFEVKVIEVNKGGAVCSVLGLKAFLPGSHYLGVPDESLIGQTLKVKFLDVIADEGKLVLSQRRALSETQVQMERGQVVKGTITGLRNYGAFLELEGGTAGLLHISQISFDRIENLESMFTIGQECKVMVIEHDKRNGRVALSTKTLESNPGDMIRNMQEVFDNAEKNAAAYQERSAREAAAREAAAKDIVAGLGSVDGETQNGDISSVADSIESILASIVSDGSEEGAKDPATE